MVWIIAGPIFDEGDEDEGIGDPGEVPVAIPDALFKIVIRASNDADLPDVLAFIFPHTEKPEDDDWPDLASYLVSVDDIERRAGLASPYSPIRWKPSWNPYGQRCCGRGAV